MIALLGGFNHITRGPLHLYLNMPNHTEMLHMRIIQYYFTSTCILRYVLLKSFM